MSRALYRWKDGKFIEISKDHAETPRPRVHVISDTIPETWNPVDGKHYESKSRMRQVAKARGLVELGNDVIEPPKEKFESVREEYERAEYEIKSRNRR